MTGRAALVAAVALGLLMGCSAPSTHPSSPTSASQATASVNASSSTSGPFKVGVVHIGAREIVFYFPYGSAIADTDVVQSMIARNWSADLMGEC